MDVPKKFQHLGWRLSTARRMDPPHRLLTSLDIDSAFKAARVEQSSGRNKKVVAIEVINTVRFFGHEWSARHDSNFLQDPVPKDFKQTKRKAVVSSSGKQSPSSLVSYTKELEKVKSRLRCSDHQPGEDTFCWVDSSLPNAPHYPLCTQDLQEWARYLVCDTYLLQGMTRCSRIAARNWRSRQVLCHSAQHASLRSSSKDT
jgi:hypothetical protein